MQPFPEIVDRIVANGYFAEQIVGCNLVASFKHTHLFNGCYFWMHTGHHLLSLTVEVGFHLPSVF